MMNYNSEDKYVELYRRVLKYPPFSPSRREGVMKIEHKLDGGGSITAEAIEYITTEDAEKLFTAIYLSKDTKEFEYEGVQVIGGKFYISELRRVTNCNNDNYLIDALKKIRNLTLTFKTKDKVIVTGLLHEVRFNKGTGEAICLFNQDFFRACRGKGLTLNLTVYSTLSPITKNLYSYIISNSGDEFYEDLLLERAVIQVNRKDNAQALLRKALQELQDKHIIISFKQFKRNGVRIYKINKVKMELSTAVGNNYP